jgi:cell fate regulator YaaT (PSP1 superfamily)
VSIPAARNTYFKPSKKPDNGKLKCCLNYELDTYLDALKGFPDFETKLVTEKAMLFVKNRIF